MLQSSRLKINYPDPSSETDTADVPRDVAALVTAIESCAIFVQTTAALRPTSTVGSPGVLGRWHYATDTGVLSYDYGTGWITISTLTQQNIDDSAFAAALIFGS